LLSAAGTGVTVNGAAWQTISRGITTEGVEKVYQVNLNGGSPGVLFFRLKTP